MTRHPISRGAAVRRGARGVLEKNAVQDITAPADGRARQVLQLRRERAERELLRQRHEGDGDQLRSDARPESTRRGTGVRRRVAARRAATTRARAGQYTFTGRIAATTDNGARGRHASRRTLADGKFYSLLH